MTGPAGRVLSLVEKLEARRREAQLARIRQLLVQINGRMDAIRVLGRMPWPDDGD